MASKYGVIILVLHCMLAVGLASRMSPVGDRTTPAAAKTITVGGKENWHFGFNYTNWAFQNSPFYLKDTLVFKFDPPSNTTFPHSVYLLRDFRSFLRCDLRRAKLVANVTQGGGQQGFKFVMKRWQPYYFACGERAGFHCNVGMMKFAVMPLPPRCHI